LSINKVDQLLHEENDACNYLEIEAHAKRKYLELRILTINLAINR